MGVARAEIDDRITQELGPQAVRQVLASLWARDCQGCGRPLGTRPPALVVEFFGTDYKAILFHPGCRASQFKDDGGIHMNGGDTLSWTSQAVGMLMRVQGGTGRAGRAGRAGQAGQGDIRTMPVLLVNPGLEMISLKRSASGEWSVSIEQEFGPMGLKAPGVGGPVLGRPLPGLMAFLHGWELVVSVSGVLACSLVLQPPDRPIIDAITAQGGVMLAVTHAVDPSEVTGPEQMRPVLAGDRSLFGWAQLQPTHHTP